MMLWCNHCTDLILFGASLPRLIAGRSDDIRFIGLMVQWVLVWPIFSISQRDWSARPSHRASDSQLSTRSAGILRPRQCTLDVLRCTCFRSRRPPNMLRGVPSIGLPGPKHMRRILHYRNGAMDTQGGIWTGGRGAGGRLYLGTQKIYLVENRHVTFRQLSLARLANHKTITPTHPDTGIPVSEQKQ